MARLTRTTNQYGCPQAPAEANSLDSLLKQRERLLRLMTSGIQELEQPVLGRTQYRSMEEMAEALRILNGMIDAAAPVTADPYAWMKKRRPVIVGPKEY